MVLQRALVLRLVALVGVVLYLGGGFAAGGFAATVAARPRFDQLQIEALQALMPPAAVVQASERAPAEAATPAPLPDQVTLLVMGVDRRDGEDWDTRTDTMMLASLDPRQKHAAVMSIPRDLWVSIPYGTGRPLEDRINAANVIGELYKHPGGGPALAMQTVALNFGVSVEHYVYVDMEAFRRFVDAIGGIDVDVPSTIVDYEYPTEDYRTQKITIIAGLQHFDGEHALQYARSRHQDSDFGRMRRQQQVIRAVLNRLRRPEMLLKLPDIIGQVQSLIRTDLTPGQVFALAWTMKDVPAAGIQTAVVDESYAVGYMTPAGASVLRPQTNRLKLLVREVFFGESHTQELTRIEVVNSAGVPALTNPMVDAVKAQGFNQVTSSATRQRVKESTVKVRAGAEDVALDLMRRLNLPADRLETDETQYAARTDIRIILGEDAKPLPTVTSTQAPQPVAP